MNKKLWLMKNYVHTFTCACVCVFVCVCVCVCWCAHMYVPYPMNGIVDEAH